MTQEADISDVLNRQEVKLPTRVLIAVELVVIPLILMVAFSIFFWLHGDAHPWSWTIFDVEAGWMTTLTIMLGLPLLLVLVMMGRFWAYLLLAALLAAGTLWDVLQYIMTRGSQATLDTYSILILVVLLSGYKQYKQFAASRHAERLARRES